jgi:hypothetical protein
MSGPVIETPRGKVFHTKSGTKAKLEWNSDFQPKHQMRYSRAQRFVDSEVLRRSEPFIPLLTGMLIKSGILATDIGSGRVSWIAPYSRKNYYSARKPGSQTGPLRGPHWFERMKQVEGRDIMAGARRIAGGRG